MSTVTFKEKNMLMITLVLVLYGAAAFFYRGQKANWEKQERLYANAKKKYAEECALVADTADWDLKYEKMCSLMPVFPYEKDVDTHWLNIMDTVASENSLSISRRQTGKEEEVGDVYELPIECKNWEGTLESLVTFLYGLRKEGAMVDVRQLYIRPATDPGYLKGTFSLHCAYMRGNVVEVEGPVSPGSATKPELKKLTLPNEEIPATGGSELKEVVPPLRVEKPTAESALKIKAPAPDTSDSEKEVDVEQRLDNPQEEVNEEEVVKAALKALAEEAP